MHFKILKLKQNDAKENEMIDIKTSAASKIKRNFYF
jgi:hypothetical protein